ncbi:hypothetical protein ABTB81_19400, partial [Acinetobacter baumannii]
AGFDHIRVYRGGDVEIQSNYTVLGNTQNHWHITEGGRLTCQSKTITITGTPTMTRWMGVANSGIANVPSNTYSGSLGGGVKCLVWKGGVADI